MDLPDHGELGDRRGADGDGEDAGAVLSGAICAGVGGGGIFSRRDRVSVALVHEARSRPRAGVFFRRHAGGAAHQPEALELPAEIRHAGISVAVWFAWVAV